jgi:hypothetical protein
LQAVIALLRKMTPVHTEGYLRITKLGPRQEKFPPQFIVHAVMIVRVQTADFKRQPQWKEHFGLNYIAASAPHLWDPKQIL